MSRVFKSLLETFSLEAISQPHIAAVCNALSAFLDAGSVSENEKTKRLVLSSDTWLSIFEIYLDRFEYAKPKPMRQVLLSLAKLLTTSQTQESHESRVFLERIGNAAIPSIVVGEPRSRLRASLVALEILIRRKAISPLQIIPMVRGWLLNHHRRWRHVLEEDYKTLGLTFSQFNDESFSEGAVEAQLDHVMVARVLVQGLLTQSSNADVASLAGSIITLFLQRIRENTVAQRLLTTKEQSLSSIWTIPAKRIMLQNLDSLDQLSNYILQPLFTVDPDGFHSFISQLPLQSLITGDMADAPSEEFILLFAALQTGKKVGLVDEDRKLLIMFTRTLPFQRLSK